MQNICLCATLGRIFVLKCVSNAFALESIFILKRVSNASSNASLHITTLKFIFVVPFYRCGRQFRQDSCSSTIQTTVRTLLPTNITKMLALCTLARIPCFAYDTHAFVCLGACASNQGTVLPGFCLSCVFACEMLSRSLIRVLCFVFCAMLFDSFSGENT